MSIRSHQGSDVVSFVGDSPLGYLTPAKLSASLRVVHRNVYTITVLGGSEDQEQNINIRSMFDSERAGKS
jgi:hypothetical protein